LCLGRAMIHDPSVLILDEPAAGLDPRARIQLREMIRELAAEGKTLLISSHILTELAEICDQVGIIEQGQLLAMGSVDDIQKEQRGQSEVRMRVLRDVEQAANYLGQRDDVDNLRTDGELLFFTHKGDREMHVQILKDLVDQNFAIAEFASHEKSLEDVFMQITAGIVQ
jgi:ABC-2 type transport system ATP-binding protein